MSRAGKILLAVSILLIFVYIMSVATFLFSPVLFAVVDEAEYWPQYVALPGYYPVINMLFMFDYIVMSLTSWGFPLLIISVALIVCGHAINKRNK
jgi:hypothetical protein